MGGGKAAAQWILTQPAKSERRQLPLLLPTLLLLPLPLLLKPLLLLLLLTSQMATLGLTQRLRHLNPKTRHRTNNNCRTTNNELAYYQ